MSTEASKKQLSRNSIVTLVALISVAAGIIIRISARSLSSDIRGAYNDRTYSAPLITPFDPLRYQLLVELSAVLVLAGIAFAILATHHWLLADRDRPR